MKLLKHPEVVERFLKYVKINTQSIELSNSTPSSPSQIEFANLLAQELIKIGVSNVSINLEGYLTAQINSNIDKQVPVIGFISHLDTSPDFTAENVSPKIFENYDGNDLLLNEKEKIFLSPSQFPDLLKYKGNTLITTDGTTLLGADDKAGIAEIITAMEYIVNHPEFKHGDIKICFTPDEELGRGTDNFNITEFNAEFAFTIDGGELGELEYENFNAAVANIEFNGTNIHPGSAKNKMVNSIQLAIEYHQLLPHFQRPEYTENYEGFFHLIYFQGDVEKTIIRYLIRDHDLLKFNNKKLWMEKSVDFINSKYGDNKTKINIKDQYFNMKEKIIPVYHIIELAQRALEQIGIDPLIKPVRGGTDGAKLSYMGLPTPNIFTGGHNFHGRYEYIPCESMEKAVEVILKIIELNSK